MLHRRPNFVLTSPTKNSPYDVETYREGNYTDDREGKCGEPIDLQPSVRVGTAIFTENAQRLRECEAEVREKISLLSPALDFPDHNH